MNVPVIVAKLTLSIHSEADRHSITIVESITTLAVLNATN